MRRHPSRPVELTTSNPSLCLRELTDQHATEYFALVQANAEHLTARGDYRDEVAATLDDVTTGLGEPTDLPVRFGVFDDDVLVGRVDLVPVDPPRFGLGYWLAAHATGRGYATCSVAALLAYAADVLDATDVYAGVTHGNTPSEAVLERLGFTRSATFETYTRWHHAFPTPPEVSVRA